MAPETQEQQTKLGETAIHINFAPDGLFCIQFLSHVDIQLYIRYTEVHFMFALLDLFVITMISLNQGSLYRGSVPCMLMLLWMG